MIKDTEAEATKELDKLRRQFALKLCPLLAGNPCLSQCVCYEAGRYQKRNGKSDYIVYGPSCTNLIITSAIYVES